MLFNLVIAIENAPKSFKKLKNWFLSKMILFHFEKYFFAILF